jgi:SAM-dependent methyltransferase
MTSSRLLAQVASYYDSKLTAHGATPAGVDWNSAASQLLRFQQLLRIIPPDAPAGILNDFGCGYGALADYLGANHAGWSYCGFDVSLKMIVAARSLHAAHAGRTFTAELAGMRKAAYTVASGIFNVKLDTPEDTWTDYMLATLDTVASLSEAGFAFNVLTSCCDPGRRRQDLYYADPVEVFQHCRARFSPRVALLHDYPLFEFTVLVRL